MSGVDQVEALLDTLYTLIHPIEAAGDAGVLVFEDAEPLFHLDHILSHALDGAPNGAEMLKDEIVGGHGAAPLHDC